ncbi:MAG: quinone-dependent dihydroorotate dehydrogenase [Burkholderiales bacterium]|jgi:dihydroorotate dehydrogenase|nr:quinone-dependent dihydroorotate dehydrogenase [Burkholderiales bacterium]
MFYELARPFLFHLDPEVAHDLALPAFKRFGRFGAGALIGLPGKPIAGAPVEAMGLTFPNAVGLAAGLDKNGEFIDVLAKFGFGFIEVGTVTPRPQPGNPRPRLFRIPEAQALVNRMGFNNHGVDAFVANVKAARFDGVLGINIGKNFDTPIERAADDYVACLDRVYALASYITVNISSPNTKNLRTLQGGDELGPLLARIARARDRQARATRRRVPLAVKIAPDLDDAAIAAIAGTLLEHEVDAVIATNTTLSRDGVAGLRHADEQGGLSGAPLRARSTAVISRLAKALGGKLPVIGVGGILSAADAQEKLDAGARLVQVYTGLIYRGPGLVREIVAALARETPRARRRKARA